MSFGLINNFRSSRTHFVVDDVSSEVVDGRFCGSAVAWGEGGGQYYGTP